MTVTQIPKESRQARRDHGLDREILVLGAVSNSTTGQS